LLPDAWSGYIIVADSVSAKDVGPYGFWCPCVLQFIIRLHHGASLFVEGKFDRHREKTKTTGGEAMMNEKFGVVQCIHCGYIQGRELVGNVFSYQGSFKSVVCYNCNKSIPLTVVNVLFKSNSAAEAHGWLVAYKKQMIRGA
jgi:hypothetical protein